MGWVPHRDLPRFRGLCGDRRMGSVVLLTTMWDEVEEAKDLKEAEKREVVLKRDAQECYRLRRFHMNDPESLWATVDEIIH